MNPKNPRPLEKEATEAAESGSVAVGIFILLATIWCVILFIDVVKS